MQLDKQINVQFHNFHLLMLHVSVIFILFHYNIICILETSVFSVLLFSFDKWNIECGCLLDKSKALVSELSTVQADKPCSI